MNAITPAQGLFATILRPLDTADLQPIMGRGVDRFINTSRGDVEVVAFLNFVFDEAAELGASDIHFQDDEYGTVVRYRTAGVLVDRYRLDHTSSKDIDSKIRARCRITQQDRDSLFDGSFWLRVDKTILDVRVSFMPTRFGQNIVCRLLDQRNAGRRLQTIHMGPGILEALLEVLCCEEGEGIILVTGPTGSGKTSTLYACLNEINNRHIHIVTAEDPVEYRLPGADQVSVHASRTFAQILRGFLRQDFDCGLVGEIRDTETAEIAFQAANTGHKMLATLHTNSALSTVGRLVDLGLDHFTVASTTRCILAQRLPQKLCPYCKVEHVLDDAERHILDTMQYEGPREFFTLRPAGCSNCRDGESGRIPVIELLKFDRRFTEAVIERDQAGMVSAAKAQSQYVPIATTALNMSAQGLIGFQRALALGGR